MVCKTFLHVLWCGVGVLVVGCKVEYTAPYDCTKVKLHPMTAKSEKTRNLIHWNRNNIYYHYNNLIIMKKKNLQ